MLLFPMVWEGAFCSIRTLSAFLAVHVKTLHLHFCLVVTMLRRFTPVRGDWLLTVVLASTCFLDMLSLTG